MNISKTTFKALNRCGRYAGLAEVAKEEENAVVAFTQDASLEDLMTFETNQKLEDLLTDMHDNDREDVFERFHNKELPLMMEDFKKIEMLAAKKIKHMFGGEIIFSEDTFQQKRFEYALEHDHLFSFLDIYQEDEASIRIIEVKATTSKKFDEACFYFKRGKDKHHMFELDGEIYYPYHLHHQEVSKNYLEKYQTMLDKDHKIGEYFYDIAYQRFIIDHALTTNKKVSYFLAVLNHEYIFDGTYDKDHQPIYTDDIIKLVDVTEVTKEMMPRLTYDVSEVLKRVDLLSVEKVKVGKHCFYHKDKECPFVPICFKDVPKEDSILTYVDRHHGYVYEKKGEKQDIWELINEGHVHALDLEDALLNPNHYDSPNRIIKNSIQKETVQYYLDQQEEKPYIHKKNIDKILKTFKYPVYHLDFESFPAPLPRFKGEIPYMQSLFQYSLHIEREPGVCDQHEDHLGFLATNHQDQRRLLVTSMLNDIKEDDGTIIVWNDSFEKTRIKELALLFPEYQERLLDIHDRIYDLMKVVKGDKDIQGESMMNYYHRKMQGSFSIKKVLPLFSHLNHQDLDVKHGGEAMEVYANFPNYDKKTFDQKYEALIEYCKLDTYAMVEILDGLRKLSENA
jgi:hypothetical protein